MKYLNGTILCLEGFEYIKTEDNPCGLVPYDTYSSQRRRKTIVVYGRGGGKGNSVLIEYESIPDIYKNLVQAKYGNPYEYVAKQPIRDLIKPDPKAIEFFERHRKPDGLPLKAKCRIEYANSAAILNAIRELLSDKKKLKTNFNITLDLFWQSAGEIVKEVSERFPNSLPTSTRRLKPTYKEYIKTGYSTLISGKLGNDNHRKVGEELERLILSLYISDKPYSKEVHEAYLRFLAGELEVVDINSGELFCREQFYKDGQPIEISDTTVWAYINKPYNRITVDKIRTGALEFNNTHAPHNHRHSPLYAFSKTTMDDLELPFKMPNGDRVKAYEIGDVASECIIGKSFGTDKNRGLFMEAIVDMFRLLVNRGWGIPAEIEVEHHIANTFADDLLKEGNVFPFVRFCRPRNPQEKRAEHIFRRKKYGLQKKREGFQGRWYGRQEATRPNEDTNTLRLPLEDIVANELNDIQKWNNQPHSNQKKYPGMSRWQVLCEHQNPHLVSPDMGLVARYIGFKTETSVNRSQYAKVKYCNYRLPHPSYMNRLQANNYDVDAYYIPDADGLIKEVHLYQHDEYICTCQKLITYNESQAEMTETDKAIRSDQYKYRKSFDKMVKENVSKLTKVKVSENTTVANAIETPVIPSTKPAEAIQDAPEADNTDYEFDADYWAAKAKQDL
jgi:hypothetical protein